MKKIILLLAFCLSVGNLFAQDANADKLREEGDAAMTAKNYPEVVAKYSEYLKLTNYEDESRIFNCAFAAYNAKKYDDAIKFYDMAIQKGYKADDAYVGKAMSLRSQDKAADFTATVEAGLKANAQNANLEKLLYAYCMKKGQAAQKAGKTEEAEENFKKVIPLNHKTYKTNALYSLGVLCYNDGANILKKAAPLANSDADKYAAEKEKADGRFKEALDYLEEAAKISPENENVKKMLPQVKAVMK